MKNCFVTALATCRLNAAVLSLVAGVALAQESKYENRATPPSRIKVAPGFHVELLSSVRAADQGSWVALCLDDKGRFYASDQYGGLYRFSAPAPGKPLDPNSIERVPADIRAVNGMHFADGALYANVNDYEQKLTSGFYKISDSDGDDRLDKVELLRALNPGGDHGLHGVVPVPGSDDFYLVLGKLSEQTIPAGMGIAADPDRWPKRPPIETVRVEHGGAQRLGQGESEERGAGAGGAQNIDAAGGTGGIRSMVPLGRCRARVGSRGVVG